MMKFYKRYSPYRRQVTAAYEASCLHLTGMLPLSLSFAFTATSKAVLLRCVPALSQQNWKECCILTRIKYALGSSEDQGREWHGNGSWSCHFSSYIRLPWCYSFGNGSMMDWERYSRLLKTAHLNYNLSSIPFSLFNLLAQIAIKKLDTLCPKYCFLVLS